jgi:hypothetical protein
MTKQAMVEQVRAEIMSESGYSFSESALVALIEAGEVPDGAVIFDDGESKLAREGSEAVAYVNGIVDNRTKIEGEAADMLLMAYANAKCRKSSGTGLRA